MVVVQSNLEIVHEGIVGRNLVAGQESAETDAVRAFYIGNETSGEGDHARRAIICRNALRIRINLGIASPDAATHTEVVGLADDAVVVQPGARCDGCSRREEYGVFGRKDAFAEAHIIAVVDAEEEGQRIVRPETIYSQLVIHPVFEQSGIAANIRSKLGDRSLFTVQGKALVIGKEGQFPVGALRPAH